MIKSPLHTSSSDAVSLPCNATSSFNCSNENPSFVVNSICCTRDLSSRGYLRIVEFISFISNADVFLIKKKRDDADDGVGCSCKPQDECGDDCECRFATSCDFL